MRRTDLFIAGFGCFHGSVCLHHIDMTAVQQETRDVMCCLPWTCQINGL